MTPKQLIQRLEAVSKEIQQVRQSLIRCAPLDAQTVPLLHQVAEAMKTVQGERELISGNELAQQLLTDIHAHTEKAGMLLESAAGLICHSALTKSPIEGSYTPDGEFPSIEFGGRMIVHA